MALSHVNYYLAVRSRTSIGTIKKYKKNPKTKTALGPDFTCSEYVGKSVVINRYPSWFDLKSLV